MPVYAAYDSMCDFLLSFLPENFRVVYGFMVFFSLFSSLSLIYFIKKFLSHLFDLKSISLTTGSILFLVLMPEFLYEVFTFKSVVIAFNLVLISSFFLIQKPPTLFRIIVSALLFGLAVSLRWNMIIYGLPQAVAFILVFKDHKWQDVVVNTVLWGGLAIVSSVLFIWISGYTPVEFLNVMLWGKSYMATALTSKVAKIANVSTFLTPVSILFLLIGLLGVLKQKEKVFNFLIFAAASFAPIFILGFSTVTGFKNSFFLWPIYVLLFAEIQNHFSKLSLTKNKYKTVLITFAIIAAAPWFIGLKIDIPYSNWGPGFQLKTYPTGGLEQSHKKIDKRFDLSNIKIGFYAGNAIPVPEGYRPLGGHFFTLFGNKLNELDAQLNEETDRVVSAALKNRKNTIVIEDRRNPYLLVSYARKGLKLAGEYKGGSEEFIVRPVVMNNKEVFYEGRVANSNKLKTNDWIIEVFKTIPYEKIYLAFTYSSLLNSLELDLKSNPNLIFERFGPFSGEISKVN